MHDKRVRNAFVVVFFVLLLFIVYYSRSAPNIDKTWEDERQQTMDSLLDENIRLRSSNDALRHMIVDMGANNSLMHTKLQYCQKWCPSFENGTIELPDPGVRVPINDILVDPDKVIINIPQIQLGKIADSNSMDPVLDKDHIVLETAPDSPDTIKTGDIIIFEKDGNRIIHRVVETGTDLFGWYAVTKGDNVLRPDPGKVRFESVKGVVVGVIY